jgi:hypothetical protein
VGEETSSVVRLGSSSVRADAHRFYQALGYTNIDTQYSFIKSLDADLQDHVSQFVFDYSYRNATIGSTLVARRAGM